MRTSRVPELQIPALRGFVVTQARASEQIAEALHNAIVAGQLEPGSRIRESALASQIGVSRNTMREAVLILQSTGLIEHEINRGMVVRAIDLNAVEDLYRVREVLELSGIEAVTVATDLSAVSDALTELERAAHRGVVEETVESDLGFHGALVSLLGSPRLNVYFAGLRSELRYYLAALSVAYRETESPAELVAQHAVILQALRAGAFLDARELACDHIQLNRRQVVELLRSRT